MIEPANLNDLPALADMLYALNAFHADHLPSRFHTMGDRAALEAWFGSALAEGARILLYRTEGLPRGYLMWRVVDRPVSALEMATRLALMDHIHVDPIWRRRGLATRLIARFETDLRNEGCSGWVSKVHAFNHASAAMMRGAGAHVSVEMYAKQMPQRV
jgi:aminoglycoside 6'-N-acetyltransferase I